MATERAAATVPDLRRDQMLRAAAELIGERGFSETRIADVARRSGASPALVIYYFGTKDQLLTEALRYSEDLFYELVAAQLEALPTGRDRLELLVRLTCVPQGVGDAVTADEQEPHPLQGGVDLRGDRGALGGVTLDPRAEVDRRDRWRHRYLPQDGLVDLADHARTDGAVAFTDREARPLF